MSVARILFKNVIRTIFVDCARLNTVEWIAPEVPIFQICRELASSRLRVLSIRLGCEDPSETQGVQSLPHTWHELRQLQVHTHFCRGWRRFDRTGVFHTLNNDFLPNLRHFSYQTDNWDADVNIFLTKCTSLEVLILSCMTIPFDIQLPSLDHLQVFGMRASSILLLLPSTLPALRTIVLLDFRDVQRPNHSLRHRALEKLTMALNNIAKHEHLENLRDVVVENVSAHVVAHLEWDESIVSLIRLQHVVKDLKAFDIRVRDNKNACMQFPFEFYPEPGVGEL